MIAGAFGFHGQKVHFSEPRLLEAARHGVCQNCGADDGTIVAAHANESVLGKGKGIRVPDAFHAHLCVVCHDYVDSRRKTERSGVWRPTIEDRRECFTRAMHRTWLWLLIEGYLVVRPK